MITNDMNVFLFLFLIIVSYFNFISIIIRIIIRNSNCKILPDWRAKQSASVFFDYKLYSTIFTIHYGETIPIFLCFRINDLLQAPFEK